MSTSSSIPVAAAELLAPHALAHEAVALVERDRRGCCAGRRRATAWRKPRPVAHAMAVSISAPPTPTPRQPSGHRHAELAHVRRGRVAVRADSPRLPASRPSTSATRNRRRGARTRVEDAPPPVARAGGARRGAGRARRGSAADGVDQLAHARERRARVAARRRVDLRPSRGRHGQLPGPRPSAGGPDAWRAGRRLRRRPAPRGYFSSSQLAALFDGGLRRGEPRDRHAERRAAHVVQPGAVAELDRLGVAAVLAADADLEVRPRACGRARRRSRSARPRRPGRASRTGRPARSPSLARY